MKNQKLKTSSQGKGEPNQNPPQDLNLGQPLPQAGSPSHEPGTIAVSISLKAGPTATSTLAPESATLAHKPKRRPRVALEPELEEIAALWSAAKRFEMARKFGRWSRQLRISGFILFHESHRPAKPSLPFLGLRKARLN